MKNPYKIILLLISMCLLSGCWNYTEINDQANVSSIAIDKGEDGKKYHITAELISATADSKEPSTPISFVEGDGNTVLDTFRKMIAISSKKLYFGHCKIVVLSEDVAREGLLPILDMIMRDAEVRMTIDFVVSREKTAKEILFQNPVLEKIVGYEIDTSLDQSEDVLFESKKREAYQIHNTLKTKGSALMLPAVDIIELHKGETTFRLNGVAVFKEDKLLGFMDQEDTKSCLFAIDQIKGGVLSVPMDSIRHNYMAAEITKNKTKITPVLKDGKLSMEIDITTDINIEQFTPYGNMSIEGSCELINQYIEQRVSKVIKEVQRDYGVDIFGFGSMIHQNKPKLWDQYKDNWEETFLTLPVSVKCSTNIKTSGVIYEALRIGGK